VWVNLRYLPKRERGRERGRERESVSLGWSGRLCRVDKRANKDCRGALVRCVAWHAMTPRWHRCRCCRQGAHTRGPSAYSVRRCIDPTTAFKARSRQPVGVRASLGGGSVGPCELRRCGSPFGPTPGSTAPIESRVATIPHASSPSEPHEAPAVPPVAAFPASAPLRLSTRR
jgi:hypothetical protein